MKFIGTVEQVLTMESGEGKNGNTWKKQPVIFKHGTDKYTKKTKVDFSGDLADTVFNVGEEMEIDVMEQLNIEIDPKIVACGYNF